MKLIDSHCHLNMEKFKDDFNEIMEDIKNNLEFVVNVGYDLNSSIESVELSKKYDYVYASVGIHPTDIGDYNESVEKKLEELAQNKKVLAIGEIGLDYHWDTQPRESQKDVFRKQIDLSKRVKKPIVIHTRDAMRDTVDILNEYKDVNGIMHCFSGSYEIAEELMDRYYFSIGGVITFKNANKLIETVKNIPIEKLMIETDSPYLTPVPFRGKRNQPTYVKYVAEKIAEIKEMSIEDVIRITNENTKRAFGIIK